MRLEGSRHVDMGLECMHAYESDVLTHLRGAHIGIAVLNALRGYIAVLQSTIHILKAPKCVKEALTNMRNSNNSAASASGAAYAVSRAFAS